jgi:hypothetical protein
MGLGNSLGFIDENANIGGDPVIRITAEARALRAH